MLSFSSSALAQFSKKVNSYSSVGTLLSSVSFVSLPLLRQTFQFKSPLLLFTPNWPWISMSSNPPLALLRASSTTASSSMGFNEHVEQRSNPSAVRLLIPLIRIFSCRGWRDIPSLECQLDHLLGNFLVAPSPEQGTSHNILLKVIFSFFSFSVLVKSWGRNWALWLITAIPAVPDLWIWWMSIDALLYSTSLAITQPGTNSLFSPYSIQSIWEVLEPGAAHMSRMLSVGWISRQRGGSMETSSCLDTNPELEAFWMSKWRAVRALDFLRICLFTLREYTSQLGYHLIWSSLGIWSGSNSPSCFSSLRQLDMNYSLRSFFLNQTQLGWLGLILNTTGSFTFMCSQKTENSSGLSLKYGSNCISQNLLKQWFSWVPLCPFHSWSFGLLDLLYWGFGLFLYPRLPIC